jgi:quinoprotein glucose dehydrogenase
MPQATCLLAPVAFLAVAGCSSAERELQDVDWTAYGGDAGGDRYAEIDQITPGNVGSLQEVWRFTTEDGGLQGTPLVIGGVLYAPTPEQGVIALDAAKGTLKWRYMPTDAVFQPIRGVSWWQDGSERRLFASHGNMLSALDPDTGKPIVSFGREGNVDLREGLADQPQTVSANMTTPGSIYDDMIIVGFRTSESHPAARGMVRAYDVRTGKLRWSFNLIPKPGETGSETWPGAALVDAGGGNNWAGMVIDRERGIVFVPTGSSVDDFYGADRHGQNLFSDSLVALDAKTGKRLWHFQTVHHDIWDRDLPTPPVLLTVTRDGRKIDAVAQGSKQGYLFLFERQTGKPLFEIEERPVPVSDVPGEQSWPTQPFPMKPAPVARQSLTADMLTTRTPEAARFAKEQFSRMVNKGPFTPLTVGRQTLVFPGFNGGMEWGGSAVDRRSGVLFVNSSDVAWTGGLETASSGGVQAKGEQMYRQNCAGCHGIDLKGSPPEFPSLQGVLSRKSEVELVNTVLRGRGRMPGFPQFGGPDLGLLFGYLGASVQGGEQKSEATVKTAPRKAPAYIFTGYRKFLDPEGYPAIAPPWGTLSAIDMNTGEFRWRVPLGYYPELAQKGLEDTGTENYGGPIVTSSGLLFIGSTIYDRKLRAFDAKTGKTLWIGDLPFAGTATPATYMVAGRQYVVIATSGARDPKGPQGAAYVAFALPRRAR